MSDKNWEQDESTKRYKALKLIEEWIKKLEEDELREKTHEEDGEK